MAIPADTRRSLLQIARQTTDAIVHHRQGPEVSDADVPGLPPDFGGAFVTLRVRGRLRGCIGTFHPVASLAATIRDMTIQANRDPRFLDRPILPEELDELDLEISVLSMLQRTDDPLSLEVGKHGVHIQRGLQGGCFLPQVATEMGWDKIEFLRRCCSSKAGLSQDAWKDPQTEVSLFTAEVFSEPFRPGEPRNEIGACP
jgi:AmmeMemoRadiSam system protein A